MNETSNTLASEILAEVKVSAKRWFIAFCVMVFLEIITIGGFLYYIHSHYTANTVSIENANGNSNYVGENLLGELINGTNTDYTDKKND